MALSLKNLKTTAAAALLSLAPAAVFAEDWKFAIEEIPGSIMDAYAQEFKKRIETATGGDVTVTIYPMGTLGTPTETVEQAADGIIQLTNVSIGNLGTIVPESQVFLLPYLLPSGAEAVSKVLSGSETIYGPLNEDFQKRGLEIMTMYSEGPQVWTTNREIRTPEDFENFKMRVMVSPILLETYKNMGASPTPLPFGEVFGALQLGAVDGQVNPIPTIEEMKFYEVTSHLIWAGEQELGDHRGRRLRLVCHPEPGPPAAGARHDGGYDQLHRRRGCRLQPAAPGRDQGRQAGHWPGGADRGRA